MVNDASTMQGCGEQRLTAIDALRGLDMFFIIGMEQVFEALSVIFPMTPTLNDRLQHAPWSGFHFYDLIFPLFAFIVGVSLVFSLSKSLETVGKMATMRKLFKRSVILYLLGVIMYGGLSNGIEQVRLLGVLQRLALCFCGAGLAFIWMSPRALVILTVGLLVGYWGMLTFLPVPGFGAGDFAEGQNLTNWIDKMYLPFRKWDGTHDPEGLLSTVPAIATSLLGVFAGCLLRNSDVQPKHKVRALLLWGVAGIALGLLWHLQFPMIKKLWTSSFVLLTAGISSILLAFFYQLIDIKQHRTWCQPFVWIGTNAITIYLLVHIVPMIPLVNRVCGGEIHASLEGMHAGLGELFTAVLALTLAVLICRILYVRKIFLRV